MAVKDLVNKTKDSDIRERSPEQRGEHQESGLMPFGGSGEFLPRFHREIDRLFENFFGETARDWRMPSLWSGGIADWQTFSPNIDIHDNGREVSVTAELPGIDEKDLDVELTGDHLTIRGEKREESDEKDKEGWRRVERRFGSFERTIPMPQGIDPENVKADFSKGVLTVTLPRRAEAQSERRKIHVGNGETSGSSREKKAA